MPIFNVTVCRTGSIRIEAETAEEPAEAPAKQTKKRTSKKNS